MIFDHMPRLPICCINNLVNVLSKRHSRIFQELEKPSLKDEGQNRTCDIAKDMEVIKIDPGCLDSE